MTRTRRVSFPFPTVTTSPRSAHFAMRSVQFAGAGEAKSARSRAVGPDDDRRGFRVVADAGSAINDRRRYLAGQQIVLCVSPTEFILLGRGACPSAGASTLGAAFL